MPVIWQHCKRFLLNQDIDKFGNVAENFRKILREIWHFMLEQVKSA